MIKTINISNRLNQYFDVDLFHVKFHIKNNIIMYSSASFPTIDIHQPFNEIVEQLCDVCFSHADDIDGDDEDLIETVMAMII